MRVAAESGANMLLAGSEVKNFRAKRKSVPPLVPLVVMSGTDIVIALVVPLAAQRDATSSAPAHQT